MFRKTLSPVSSLFPSLLREAALTLLHFPSSGNAPYSGQKGQFLKRDDNQIYFPFRNFFLVAMNAAQVLLHLTSFFSLSLSFQPFLRQSPSVLLPFWHQFASFSPIPAVTSSKNEGAFTFSHGLDFSFHFSLREFSLQQKMQKFPQDVAFSRRGIENQSGKGFFSFSSLIKRSLPMMR